MGLAAGGLVFALLNGRDPVETTVVCVDPKLQRREYKNVWHNAGIRSAIHTMAAPLRRGRARSQR